MSSTLQELKAEEDYHNLLINNRDDALNEFYSQVDAIVLKVQHLVFEDKFNDVIKINDVPLVAEAIKEVKELSVYKYTIGINSKYTLYKETFEYDFTQQANALLVDELGYTGEWL